MALGSRDPMAAEPEGPRRGAKPREERAPTVGNGDRRYRPGSRSKASKVSKHQGGISPRRRGTAGIEGAPSRGRSAAGNVPTGTDSSESVGARNAANPRIGSGMQQARDPPGGGSRRGGEKPRGRNRTTRWIPRRRSRALGRGGSGHPKDTPMEGRSGEAQERKTSPHRASGEAVRAEPGR